MTKFFAGLFLFFSPLLLVAQTDDPVLFTVDGQPVHVSEFTYIYNKTNAGEADYSRRSVEEYLDLYKKFKLKVAEAKAMQLDTIPSLKKELEGYRRQLANSYLVDKEVTRKLTEEATQHMQYDVDISHIFIAIPTGMRDTTVAYRRIMQAKDRIEAGEKFAQVAGEVSEDNSTNAEGGRVGYITAMFPNGFYPLEKMAYSLEPGEIGGPVRSSAGYHLVKLNDKRPARGKIQVAHILVRKTKDRDDAISKAMADSLYAQLKSGYQFSRLASEASEDQTTSKKGGVLPKFGINQYDQSFEEAAFGIPEDGMITSPIETRLGWHILKRVQYEGIASPEELYPLIQPQVKRDERHQKAEDALVEQIKQEANYQLNTATYALFLDSLGEPFITHRWEVPNYPQEDQTLFTIGKNTQYTLVEFAEYCKRSTRIRLRGMNMQPEGVADQLLQAFVKDAVLKYEEKRLEEKYPEFKALMREYEEGILLFEATRRVVWDKASQDTLGLEKFYKGVKGKYEWNPRAKVTEYTILPSAANQLEAIRAYAADHSQEEVLAKYNNDDRKIVFTQEKMYEKGKEARLNNIPFEAGALSDTQTNSRNRTLSFFKIEETLPARLKTLEEARGFVIADYQDYLEKQWVKSLKSKYPIKVNSEMLEELIQE